MVWYCASLLVVSLTVTNIRFIIQSALVLKVNFKRNLTFEIMKSKPRLYVDDFKGQATVW